MTRVLYKDLAKYYDLIYEKKDYKKESEKIIKLIKKYKKSDKKELLDIGCGTGRHLKYFKRNFLCIGLDKNKEILRIAKRNIKSVKFKQGSMINFKLNKKFDVITCLFSTIAYSKTRNDFKKTMNNFSRHLKKGGVLIIEPWFTKSTFKDKKVHMTIYDGKDAKFARLSYSMKKDDVSIIYMQYLVAEKGKGISYFKEKHKMLLIEINKFLEIMKDIGLKGVFLKNGLSSGRGLYIGVKK